VDRSRTGRHRGAIEGLADCQPDEVWKGLLSLAVSQYRFLFEQIDHAERQLDALASRDEATQLLESIPGVGPRTAEATPRQSTRFGIIPSGVAHSRG
jgi:transposase